MDPKFLIQTTDDKAADELFEDCLANTIADLRDKSQLVEGNYWLVG